MKYYSNIFKFIYEIPLLNEDEPKSLITLSIKSKNYSIVRYIENIEIYVLDKKFSFITKI